MRRTVEQIERILKKYLELESVHYGFKVKNIVSETISTYDGTYPSIEIFYENFDQFKNSEIKKNLQKDIEGYTGLKYGRDYWLGINLFS